MLGSLSLANCSDALQSLLRLSFSSWQTAIAGVLRKAIDRGDLRNRLPDELAAFLLNSYEGAWKNLRRPLLPVESLFKTVRCRCSVRLFLFPLLYRSRFSLAGLPLPQYEDMFGNIAFSLFEEMAFCGGF